MHVRRNMYENTIQRGRDNPNKLSFIPRSGDYKVIRMTEDNKKKITRSIYPYLLYSV